MTEHDAARERRAILALAATYPTAKARYEAILDAAAGLQSTDAPELVPLWERAEAALKQAKADLEAAKAKSDGFTTGYSLALHAFETQDEPEYVNPYAEGTDEWRGYEEAVYDLTQKGGGS